MTQNTLSHSPAVRPRARGIGLLVGVAALLTPLAIAPAAPAKHTLRATGYSALCASVLGDGGGQGGPGTPLPSVDGIGSLGSSAVQLVANLICYSSRQAQGKAGVATKAVARRTLR